MKIVDKINEAKELSDIVKTLLYSKKHIFGIFKKAEGVNSEESWEKILSRKVYDKDLNYNGITLREILAKDQDPEHKLENSLKKYLKDNVYTGMRGYFLNLYQKTANILDQVQSSLGSGGMQGLDKAVIKMGIAQGILKKGIQLPALALSYAIAKPILYMTGYLSGIYGGIGKGTYLSDNVIAPLDDAAQQADTLVHLTPLGLGDPISKFLHLNTIDNRVDELIGKKATLYVLNQIRQKQGKSILNEKWDLPRIYDAGKQWLKDTKIRAKGKIVEYSERIGSSLRHFYQDIVNPAGYKTIPGTSPI